VSLAQLFNISSVRSADTSTRFSDFTESETAPSRAFWYHFEFFIAEMLFGCLEELTTVSGTAAISARCSRIDGA
jgi:hypothetical protein